MTKLEELLDAAQKHTGEAVRYTVSGETIESTHSLSLKGLASAVICCTYALSFLCQAGVMLAGELALLRAKVQN